MRIRGLLVVVVSLWGGCGTYVTPGAPAQRAPINRADVAEAASRKPTATFPAHLVVVRIQGHNYRSYSADGYGTGRFTAITTQELATERTWEEVAKWPALPGGAPVSRLSLPTRMDSIDDLSVAGARVQADIMMVYTIDTSFRVLGRRYGPLSTISLGIAPDRDAYITATASALLIDVRTGFVYGVAE